MVKSEKIAMNRNKRRNILTLVILVAIVALLNFLGSFIFERFDKRMRHFEQGLQRGASRKPDIAGELDDFAAGLGRVARVVGARPAPLYALLAGGLLPVVAPLALDEDGVICNVNADAAAAGLAGAMSARLVLLTDTDGVLDALEDRDLIERRRGADRRTNGLWLTQAGRLLVARLKRRIEQHESRVAARLTAAERTQLLALLEKLAG